jgi:hypothetical protein
LLSHVQWEYGRGEVRRHREGVGVCCYARGGSASESEYAESELGKWLQLQLHKPSFIGELKLEQINSGLDCLVDDKQICHR